MSARQPDTFNFKKIPKVFNHSGSSISTFSQTSTPYSSRTAFTSVSSTPLAGVSKEYRFNFPNSTPMSGQRKNLLNSINTNDANCCFCNEPLQNIFEGEQIVDLKCGHVLHLECLKELISPIDGISETIQLDTPDKLTCPSCNEQTACCDSTMFLDATKSAAVAGSNPTLSKMYDNILNPHDKFSNIMASIDNFQIPSMSLQYFSHFPLPSPLDSRSSNSTEDPITPQNQIGKNFWDHEDELVLPSITNSVSSKSASAKSPTSASNNEIELAKLLFAPEFSSVNINDRSKADIGCVLNVSVTEFESSLEFNKKEQIKAQIGKNKITDIIINNLNQNIPNLAIDFSSVGNLILFDMMDITIKLNTFASCQVYLFDSNIIILNSQGTQLLLNQELNSQTFISSIYSTENNIIINMNSIKIPSITFTSENKILRHKWWVTLNKIHKKIPTSNTIPLIQISTNAWNLISSDNDDDVLPNDIKIFNKLTSRGLDLPSGFLKRQILRPDPIPMILILAVPLVNSEDYGLENDEYADVIKGLLINTLSSMRSEDKLGVIFLGNHVKNLSVLGNYYGCISKDWAGWQVMLDSITESVITEEGKLPEGTFWDDGLKYVELLANIGFNHTLSGNSKKVDYLHQIICVSNELLMDFATRQKHHRNSINIRKTNEDDDDVSTIDFKNPFLKRRKSISHRDLNERISDICDKYHANFNLVLLADEFKYEVNQILNMNRYLKDRTRCDYNNEIKLSIALDFENLGNMLELYIEKLHNITIRKLETSITFPKYVQLKGFETNNGIKETDSDEYVIKMRNIPSGFEKSFLFNVRVDFDDENFNKNYKATIATSKTKFVSDKESTQFENQADIKLISNESNIESNITLNLNIEKPNESGITFGNSVSQAIPISIRPQSEDLNLSIVSRLSNVSDAYYIRREIQLLVAEKLCESVLEVENFDTQEKENAKSVLKDLTHTIWEFANSCNSSNTNNIKDNNMERWSEKLISDLEEIIDGYSLRNYQLSNMKCMSLFLEIE